MHALYANPFTNQTHQHHYNMSHCQCPSCCVQQISPYACCRANRGHPYYSSNSNVTNASYNLPRLLQDCQNISNGYTIAARHIQRPYWSRIEEYGEFASISEATKAAMRHYHDGSSPVQKLSWHRHHNEFTCATHFSCQHKSISNVRCESTIGSEHLAHIICFSNFLGDII